MMRGTFLCLVIIVTWRSSYCDNFNEQLEEQLNATATDLQYTKRVLICLFDEQRIPPIKNNALFRTFPHQIECHHMLACSKEVNKNFNQSILAVVAPRPLKLVDRSEIPMYFYDEPNLTDSSRDIFRNAVVLGEWQSLKYAFSWFIREQDWKRIAIISDNSLYSAAFEEELVRHFREKQLVYHTGRCVNVSPSQPCDFDEAVKYVKDHEALIVVANVNYEHEFALLRAVLAHETTPQQGFVWLTRHWIVGRNLAKDIGVAFSFTLAPKLGIELSSIFPEMKTSRDDDPSLTSILHGLAVIHDAVKSTKKDRIDYYYRDIARHMDDIVKNGVQMQAYVHKIINRNASVIAIGNIRDQNAQLHTKRPAFSSKIYDQEGCFLRSEDFEKPCNDIRLIIIMFVLATSVLIISLLIVFFNHVRENHVRLN